MITARAGSRRLPGKNVRLLGGKPLLAWTLDATFASGLASDVLVSTDDATAADIGLRRGALVPWLRPAELATDDASSVDVALHALEWYESERGVVDALLLLQPTSPFRTAGTIRRALETFERHRPRPVVSVARARTHPMRCFSVDADRMHPYVPETPTELVAQALPPAFVVNGAIYVAAPAVLRDSRTFLEDAVPLVMEEPGAHIDIDDELDWLLAEEIARRLDR